MIRTNISGIYKIQSIIHPERIYIGSSINIQRRWNEHLKFLRRNSNKSPKLQNHFNKYGESDLQFSILLGCNKEYLIMHEQYFIDALNPWFNIRKIAESNLGIRIILSEKTKMRMFIKQLDKICKRIIHKAILAELKVKEDRVVWNKGLTKETNNSLKVSSQKRIGKFSGNKNPYYGKTHSKEIKKIIGEKSKQKIFNSNYRNKLSISHSGEKNPMYGRKQSIETRIKMKEKWQLRKLKIA